MRIGCLQFAPQVGDINNNLNRADSVLSKANLDDLDLLVLPELAFSGYNFRSLQEITPFLEHAGSGISSLWARTIALKHNCVVAVGYPEKADVSPKWPTGPEYYNSVIVVNGDGETISNYRKSFLYYTDETWALEGNRGFYKGFIPRLGDTSIGICMDLNPYKFEAPWDAFEFAYHVIEAGSNLVIVSMAWMTREEHRLFTRRPNDPDMETLTYWVTRLEPLIRSDKQGEIIVVFCNRSGNEDEVMYAGTSAVVGIHHGQVKIYGLLGRGEKELLVVDTDKAPYAKLVYRQDTGGSGVEEPGHLQRNTEPDNLPTGGSSHYLDNANPGDAQQDKSNAEGAGSYSNCAATGSYHHQLSVSALPPSQTLPSDLIGTPLRNSTGKRETPTITVPSALPFIRASSARSPVIDSSEILTPSAPSPTPMALRPRLIIPQSPPILPHQYPSDHPISAASLRSVQSAKSYTSSASINTVRSNPRPPEDSTPYPQSSAPLSGYPSNSWQSEMGPYGRDVHFNSANDDDDDDDDALSSARTYDDLSPMSRWAWKSADSTARTPLTAGWAAATPIGRKPEPFPWPAITNDTRPQSPDTIDEQTRNNAAPKGIKRTSTPLSHISHSNAFSNWINKTDVSEPLEAFRGRLQSKPRDVRTPARPPSRKSRTTSRTRVREASDSTPCTTSSQQVESVSHRAESTNRLRTEYTKRTPRPDRSQSRKSRQNSRSRPGDGVDFQQDHQVIHIAASPSIIMNDDDNAHRLMPRANSHQRSDCSQSLNNIPHGINSESNVSQVAGSRATRTASRAMSQGRTPWPKGPSKDAAHVQHKVASVPADRARSQDSVRNEVLHRRVDSVQSHDRHSRPRKTSRSRNARAMSREAMAAEFERPEAAACPNCLSHRRRSSSAGMPLDDNAASRYLALTGGSSNQSSPVITPAQLDHLINGVLIGDTLSLDYPVIIYSQGSFLHEGAEASDSCSLAETLQTVSTPGRSPTAPSFFNPSTPKAMVLKTDDSDIDFFPTGYLNSAEVAATDRHVEAGTVQVV